jgi:hypothetical protein
VPSLWPRRPGRPSDLCACLLPGRVENLAELPHDKHHLAQAVAKLSDGEVGHRRRGVGEELLDPVDQRVASGSW